MRGNSGFLRYTFVGILAIFAVCTTVNCGPVRSKRIIRETEYYTFNNDSQTTEKATCNYNGKEVERASVKCDPKPGCLPIQSHGACCPEYQCDCTRDGNIYKNGEKFSENPCRGCVCRGGEISCSDVICYYRNDCKPKIIDGRCCPDYDNCPPLDDVKHNFSNENTTSEEKFSLKSTTSTPIRLEEVSTTETDSKLSIPDNQHGFRIKEITKTEEIRITDDRPKPFKPTRSSEVTTSRTSTTLATSSQSTEKEYSSVPTSQTPFPSSSISTTDRSIGSDINSGDQSDEGSEILEPTLNRDIEDQNELENDYGNTKGDDLNSNKNVRQVDNATNDLQKIDPTSSASEENDLDSDPIIKISSSTPSQDLSSTSDKESESPENKDPVVLVVDHKGHTQSIVVVDADGLQKVEEPIDEQDENKSHPKVFIIEASTVSMVMSTESLSTFTEQSSTVSPKFSSSEMLTDNQIYETKFYDTATSGPFDLSSKEITHPSLGHSTKNPFSSEENIPLSSSESFKSAEDGEIFNKQSEFMVVDSATDHSMGASQKTYAIELFGTEEPDYRMVSVDTKYYDPDDQIEGSSSPYDYSSSSSSSSTTESNIDMDNDEDVENNENPAYPKIPDDLTQYGNMQNDEHQQSITEGNDIVPRKEESKSLLRVLPLKSNGTLSDKDLKSTTVGPPADDERSSKIPSSREESSSTIGPQSSSDESISLSSSELFSEGSSSMETESSKTENRHGSTSADEFPSSTSASSLSTENDESDSRSLENLNLDNNEKQFVAKQEQYSNYFFELAKDFFRYQSKMIRS